VSVWKVATVATVHEETSTARVLEIDVPGWPGNIAGQHVDVRLTAEDGYQAVRSYSLASFGPGERLQLAVDRLPDGEVSPYLVDDVLPGDQLEIRGPLGAWFTWTPDLPESVQLIAGGSGIVPIMAMVRAHTVSGSVAPFRLLYSVRTSDDAFYRTELDTPTPGLEVTWLYTRTRAAGRVNVADLVEATFAASISPAVYICGPTGFVETVANALVTLGHDPARVKTERFGGS
jgi:ferredoxin-NADP reductase